MLQSQFTMISGNNDVTPRNPRRLSQQPTISAQYLVLALSTANSTAVPTYLKISFASLIWFYLVHPQVYCTYCCTHCRIPNLQVLNLNQVPTRYPSMLELNS
jgi:hypothetical protein